MENDALFGRHVSGGSPWPRMRLPPEANKRICQAGSLCIFWQFCTQIWWWFLLCSNGKCRLKTPCDELILNKFSLGIHNAVEHCLSLLWNWLDLCREERQKCTWSFWLGGPRWSSLPEKQIPGTPQNIVLLLVEGRRTFRGLIFRILIESVLQNHGKIIYIVLLNKLFCSECF